MALTTDNIKYASTTTMICTIEGLATSATVGRQSTVVDNSTNLYDDVLVTTIIKTTSSTLGSTKTISVYVYGSEDGSVYTKDDGAIGGGDAAYTINSPSNLKLAAILYCPSSSTTYGQVFAVANLFGGVMPRKWGIVVCNDTNQVIDSNATLNQKSYTGITYTNQ